MWYDGNETCLTGRKRRSPFQSALHAARRTSTPCYLSARAMSHETAMKCFRLKSADASGTSISFWHAPDLSIPA